MKRNKFNLSHYKLLTCKMGQLVPIAWLEVLPGDTIQHATHGLIRCAPVVTPVMHPVKVRFHHFFVPNRIIWANWPNFITGGPAGTDTTSHPYIAINGNTQGVSSLSDYLGMQTVDSVAINVNALPYRAYALIWNEWFRDEDLQTALTVSTGDGVDTTTNVALQNVCWEKDYLTSSRPWTSKGNAVNIPLQGQAPVQGIGWNDTSGSSALGGYWNSQGVHITSSALTPTGQVVAQTTSVGAPGAANPPLINVNLANPFGASTPGMDPLALRHALAIERYQEARARYGSRYTEYLRYLGVRSSDARLQRPELLGSGRQTIQFSEVMQTGVTTSGTGGGAGGVGQFGGHGISAVRSNRYRRFFEEHGIVLTLMSVVPRSMYSQRMMRGWLRGVSGTAYPGLNGSREDYWQKELEYIGSQGVNGLEVDHLIGSNTIFGYQDRYDEYRRCESQVAGLFRTTLDSWHLSREFGTTPSLNSTFVSCVPSQRIFADTTNDNLYCMINHSIIARRLLARSGGQSFAR